MYSAASVTVCVLDDERPRRHVVRSRHASHTRNEGATLCIITTDTYWCRILKLQTLDRDDSDLITEYLAFAEIYRFILRAAAAKAMFERYLAGELSDELLTISRHCVEADRVGRHTKAVREDGGSDAFNVVS